MSSPVPAAHAGYAIVGDVLDAVETSELLRALETSRLRRSRAGARHLMHHPTVRAVASDERLRAIAKAFLGPAAVPYRATLFDKSSSRNWLVTWHQDTALPLQVRRNVAGWGPWSAKAGLTYALAPASALSRVVALRVHLDDSLTDNGPLRVLPGTHTLGVLSKSEIDFIVREGSPVECLASRGGIVAMRPLILHASSRAVSNRPRRVLHIEYAAALDLDGGLRIAVA